MNDYREHELLISYYKSRTDRLVQGRFGITRGHPVVYITRDPQIPGVDCYHSRRYRLSSARGQKYAALIMEYEKNKHILDELIAAWNSLYCISPREIEYPLTKRNKSIFTSEFFDRAEEMANPVCIEHPIEYKGHILRSKNELLGCQILEKLGYEYKVEIAVGNDPYNMLYPDLTFKVPEQERCIGVEFNGALDKMKSAEKYLSRQKNYIGYGLMISKDVIFVDMADPGSFYAELFETQIKLAVMAGLDDIVFPNQI